MAKPHYRATYSGPVMLNDGLVNFTTGLSVVGQSKVAAGTYRHTRLDTQVLDAAYRSSWIAKAAVDMPVDDALSLGRAWQGDTEQINAIEVEENRLGWIGAVRRAKKMARRDGGAAILVDDGGDTSEEFDPARVPVGGIRKLIVLSRRQLAAGLIELDIMQPGYGRPQTWTVVSGTRHLVIHPSRLAFFVGDGVLDELTFGAGEVWGDSVLESRLNAIRDADAAISNIAELIYEANVDAIGIPDFTSQLAQGGEEQILKRIQLMRLGKSNSKTLVHDKEETFDRKAISFGALPDLLREMMQVASGAVQIPATRLLGRSPAGMNSTGDGDERVYYDRLAGLRGEIESEGNVIDRSLVNSALGSWPEGLHYAWPPLRKMSDRERAEIGKMLAEKWDTISRAGTLSPEEMRATMTAELIETGVAPGLEAAMEETPDFGFDEV